MDSVSNPIWNSLTDSLKKLLNSARNAWSSMDPSIAPNLDEPLVLLSKQYPHPKDADALLDHMSRPWMTYRSHFPPIIPHGFTSDVGWGCMLRSGQMLLCSAFMELELGRDWRLTESDKNSLYIDIMTRFLDGNTSPFSIHRIALAGQSFDKQVGEWFGPSTISHVLKVLVSDFHGSGLDVYVTNDGTIYKSQIRSIFEEAKERDTRSNLDSKEGGLLLTIPLRLGVEKINPIYIEPLKHCFDTHYCIGIAGGRPNSSLFFIGYQQDKFLYLDPHHLRPSIPLKDFYHIEDLASFHTPTMRTLSVTSMDPSLVIGFVCHSLKDFDAFCESVITLTQGNAPLFTIDESPPDYKSAKQVDWISDDE